MSKLMTVFCSFSSGIFCTVLFFGFSGTFAQQATPPPIPPPSIADTVGVEPLVPALPKIESLGSTLRGPLQQLDGLNCTKCNVYVSAITYAGGPFRCDNCDISTHVWVFKGAALNTFNLLKTLRAFPAPKTAPVPQLPTLEQAAAITIDPPEALVTLTTLAK
jgi:hypothetical protein